MGRRYPQQAHGLSPGPEGKEPGMDLLWLIVLVLLVVIAIAVTVVAMQRRRRAGSVLSVDRVQPGRKGRR
jgi:hypothetical protein